MHNKTCEAAWIPYFSLKFNIFIENFTWDLIYQCNYFFWFTSYAYLLSFANHEFLNYDKVKMIFYRINQSLQWTEEVETSIRALV